MASANLRSEHLQSNSFGGSKSLIASGSKKQMLDRRQELTNHAIAQICLENLISAIAQTVKATEQFVHSQDQIDEGRGLKNLLTYWFIKGR